jgi:hypothetical protein
MYCNTTCLRWCLQWANVGHDCNQGHLAQIRWFPAHIGTRDDMKVGRLSGINVVGDKWASRGPANSGWRPAFTASTLVNSGRTKKTGQHKKIKMPRQKTSTFTHLGGCAVVCKRCNHIQPCNWFRNLVREYRPMLEFWLQARQWPYSPFNPSNAQRHETVQITNN